MARLSIVDLQNLAASVGFPVDAVPTAAAVAKAESDGNPQAVGDLTLGVSIGLWQINLRAHPSLSRDALFDPVNNAKAALAISRGGTDWRPWTTYRIGAYKKYLQPYAGGGAALAAAQSTSPLLIAGGIIAVAAAAAVAIVVTR
jgi:hypothetical protein